MKKENHYPPLKHAEINFDQNPNDLLRPLAHDIRNPLNNIVVLTDCLNRIMPDLKSKIPSKVNNAEIKYLKYIESIKNEVFKTDNIIKEYSKANKSSKPKLLNLKNTLKQIIESYENTYSHGMRSYELYYHAKYQEFSIDKAKIIRVVDNMLSNSTKFTEKGMIIVEVSCDSLTLSILFKDSGSGIPSEELGQIFKPGFRGKTHLRHPGSGLGLFNVEKIITELNGTIEVGSKIGVGSVFKLNIPLSSIMPDQEEMKETEKNGRISINDR